MSDSSSIPPVRFAKKDKVQDSRFPCEQCGADLRYTPGATELTCAHCGHVQQIIHHADEFDALREIDFNSMLKGQVAASEFIETKMMVCPNCGAQTDMHEATQAARCPFCDTPVVTDTGEHRFIKPKALVPFVLDEKTARTAMNRWLGRLWFAPNGLKEYARNGRHMNGIYVPYWTYDADTKSRYTGQRGDHYYETQTVMRDGKAQRVQVQKTRWRNVSGRVARWFDDVLVLASTSLPKQYTDGLQPWDLKGLKPYQPQYLAGFSAEGYHVKLEDGFTEARAIMKSVIENDVRRDIGGDVQRISALHTDINDVTFKHILLPVWMAAYKYQDKTYRFVVNAQTGKVQGERPYSKWKIALAILLGILFAIVLASIWAQTQ
jgi:LSD1 subclass zinc finger protein